VRAVACVLSRGARLANWWRDSRAQRRSAASRASHRLNGRIALRWRRPAGPDRWITSAVMPNCLRVLADPLLLSSKRLRTRPSPAHADDLTEATPTLVRLGGFFFERFQPAMQERIHPRPVSSCARPVPMSSLDPPAAFLRSNPASSVTWPWNRRVHERPLQAPPRRFSAVDHKVDRELGKTSARNTSASCTQGTNDRPACSNNWN